MKRSIIFLMALIVLCTLPVFAKTIQIMPQTNESSSFLDLIECNDSELESIQGDGMYVTDPEFDSDYVVQKITPLGGGRYEVTTTYYNFEVKYNNGQPVYLVVHSYTTVSAPNTAPSGHD